MATRRRAVAIRRRGKRKFTLPLAIVAGFAPLGKNLYDGFRSDAGLGAMDRLPGVIGIGTSGKWEGWSVMKERGVPAIIAGLLVHWLAGRLGINRMIARAGIPVIRL